MSIEDITRREAIAEYEVVGRAPEPDLEGLVQLAATLCQVPRAVINIIDDRAQHQIAAFGFAPDICSREDSMCAKVFREHGHTVVSDARDDDRFRHNPFVTGEIASVRFYASSPLVTPDGIPIGTLCVFDEEVGELSDADSRGLALLAHQAVDVLELRRMTRELGRSNESLSQFAGQVSHDLRNPLTALAGFLELAADSPELVDAPNAARALARAEAATARMSALVEDLLDYARIGGGHARRPVDLAEVAAAVVDDLSAPLTASRATLEVDPLPVVLGDETLLRALLQNLLANAVKFSSAGGRAPRVAVRCDELEGGWRVRVDDDGPGVPEAERERVFGLLARGDGRDEDGLGIGLSTCRRIVDALGGRIGIDESPLGGASVWFLLPE
ncbi:GAF domain-containing sensor histidine kinase [Agrococcus sp. SL85]|uniref:sensor histidine kinase n=1 Tax=Agrococcus sp. SL85 TaxID=2995141 RepID=UPI00226CEECB|nr:GAF domain-containing sensor histidine kinase [Agrococcus sp. SL85]WAC65373.1 GAF domain-containing sensor histidine kinase [Agrococcus sp. SL85]